MSQKIIERLIDAAEKQVHEDYDVDELYPLIANLLDANKESLIHKALGEVGCYPAHFRMLTTLEHASFNPCDVKLDPDQSVVMFGIPLLIMTRSEHFDDIVGKHLPVESEDIEWSIESNLDLDDDTDYVYLNPAIYQAPDLMTLPFRQLRDFNRRLVEFYEDESEEAPVLDYQADAVRDGDHDEMTKHGGWMFPRLLVGAIYADNDNHEIESILFPEGRRGRQRIQHLMADVAETVTTELANQGIDATVFTASELSQAPFFFIDAIAEEAHVGAKMQVFEKLQSDGVSPMEAENVHMELHIEFLVDDQAEAFPRVVVRDEHQSEIAAWYCPAVPNEVHFLYRFAERVKDLALVLEMDAIKIGFAGSLAEQLQEIFSEVTGDFESPDAPKAEVIDFLAHLRAKQGHPDNK